MCVRVGGQVLPDLLNPKASTLSVFGGFYPGADPVPRKLAALPAVEAKVTMLSWLDMLFCWVGLDNLTP